MNTQLSKSMIRELKSYRDEYGPTDPYEWECSGMPGSLWFVARDRTISALVKRGLLADGSSDTGLVITDAGRAAIDAARMPLPKAPEGG